jgi:copper chaperone
MKTTTLTIKGMHCNACVMLLTDVLTELPGVADAKVAMGSASVEYDPSKTSTAELQAAIEAEGYKVE